MERLRKLGLIKKGRNQGRQRKIDPIKRRGIMEALKQSG
jgi:hypothetical protein